MFRRRRATLDDATAADLTRLAPPERHEAIRSTAERKGLFAALLDDSCGRWFMTDAEDLAEGGVAEFLAGLATPLQALGAAFGSVAEGIFDDSRGQTVIVDGVEETIWTADEAKAGEVWSISTVRTYALVNARLAAAGSPERLYAVNGGNDLQAVFLTERLATALAKELEPRDRPYLPTEDSR